MKYILLPLYNDFHDFHHKFFMSITVSGQVKLLGDIFFSPICVDGLNNDNFNIWMTDVTTPWKLVDLNTKNVIQWP